MDIPSLRRSVPWPLLALTGLLILRQAGWALWGQFNVDEFENLQVLWLWDRGVLPFRDYLHSHLPTFSFLLYPIYALVGPGPILPAVVRLIAFPLQLLLLWELYTLGRLVTGRSLAGVLAVGFALTSPIIGASLSEVRGDTVVYPMILGSLLCLWYLIESGGKLRWFYLAGLLIGLSLMFTQKAVLLSLVLALFFERHLARGLGMSFGRRLLHWLGFTALAVGPFLVALVTIGVICDMNAANMVALPDNGIRFAESALLTRYRLLLWPTIILPTLIFVGPAWYAALRLVRGRASASSAPQTILRFCAVYALLALVQLILMPVLFMHIFILPYLFFALLAAWYFLRKSRRTVLVVFVIGLALAHAQIWNSELYSSRERQMTQMKFVAANVPADKPVLDPLNGAGSFRPLVGRHLHYRPFFFAGEFYDDESRLVARALAQKEFGAVIDQYVVREHLPYGIKRIIERNYQWAPESEGILVPRP
ncbi:MAG: hypothetical protein P9L99_12130 [Candidatus Lernaella stagnicola]|nr:hypothetical protein [Candidatus Lernaella stagnicola]